jgi:hypothetical protein
MPHAFEQTVLWQRTLADYPEDPYRTPRQALRSAYLQFRATVEPLAAEIARSMPMFTDHSIAHIDALWDTASLVTGGSFPINAAEAFVLGGTFLLHDVGMGLASFSGGLADIETDPSFDDLFASTCERLRRADPFGDTGVVDRAAREENDRKPAPPPPCRAGGAAGHDHVSNLRWGKLLSAARRRRQADIRLAHRADCRQPLVAGV